MIKIVTDSTCDLPPEVIQKYGITVVPCYINFPEKSYLDDGIEMSRALFYEKLAHSNPSPTTSAPALGTFTQIYRDLLAKGASTILSIHISPQLSGVYNVAVLAAEALENASVHPYDPGQLSLGTGLVVEAAAKAAQEGKSFDEVSAIACDVARRTHTFAAVDTLTYLQRSGRLSHIKASIGSLLQIKPILQMNQGKISMLATRTFSGAVSRLLDILKSLGPLEQLALVHTNAPDRARLLYDKSQPYFPNPQEFYTVDVTPILGSHLGPGVFGFVAVTV